MSLKRYCIHFMARPLAWLDLRCLKCQRDLNRLAKLKTTARSGEDVG